MTHVDYSEVTVEQYSSAMVPDVPLYYQEDNIQFMINLKQGCYRALSVSLARMLGRPGTQFFGLIMDKNQWADHDWFVQELNNLLLLTGWTQECALVDTRISVLRLYVRHAQGALFIP